MEPLCVDVLVDLRIDNLSGEAIVLLRFSRRSWNLRGTLPPIPWEEAATL